MSGSSFGKILQLSTFGESHGFGVGGILDGFPPLFQLDIEEIQKFVAKRRPGQSTLVTQRKEEDKILFLSGLLNNQTTGTPIAFMVKNEDAKSKDYSHNQDVYRPSHADFTFDKKFGIRDHRGGGRSSARETVARVIAGGMAKQYLSSLGIEIQAFVDQVGDIHLKNNYRHQEGLPYLESEIESNLVRCPDAVIASKMEELIRKTKKNGDTIGGCISCRITGTPVGLGEPVFDKLSAILGQAMLSINAVKGVEFGEGFDCVKMKGSEHNDAFTEGGKTKTNYSAGMQGGISNGMPIDFRVAFKPVATIMHTQETIDSEGKAQTIGGKGRHDACVVPRAVPIVEAMAALVILDFYLLQKAYQ
jgi:chorismate synthase